MEGRGHSRMGALLCLEVDIDTSLIYLLLASMMLFFFFSPPSLKNIRTFLLLCFLSTAYPTQTFAKYLSVIN